MWLILFFRICLVGSFLFAVWKWGDWKNWKKYYPTVLFVMVVNLGASYITYHHGLWNYHQDQLVKTQSTVELINSFVMLPSSTFVFLSNFPVNRKLYQYGYILLWVLIFSSLEYIDKTIGGIYYSNGWLWQISTIFDIAMFSIIRLHHLSPLRAWLITLFLTGVILIVFNFGSAEMK
ncbi:CBO0543 family protein [Sporomusa malonica]|uniref:Uncharacterized protein n=1 Tax=Sporomusa malonica TaxID=112901 RepID=A0A1W2EI91_9FIRM|nr:CBO0543 family protein [Sporomusa malonica]SMD09413.1 hypothetical protein SAMN04488500_12482 [Sporomusa malonica]